MLLARCDLIDSLIYNYKNIYILACTIVCNRDQYIPAKLEEISVTEIEVELDGSEVEDSAHESMLTAMTNPESSGEYVEPNEIDLPPSVLPTGPVELTEYPDGAIPILTVRRYRIASALAGPISLLLFVESDTLDESQFVGKIFSLRETTGEGGLEPLFTPDK